MSKTSKTRSLHPNKISIKIITKGINNRTSSIFKYINTTIVHTHMYVKYIIIKCKLRSSFYSIYLHNLPFYTFNITRFYCQYPFYICDVLISRSCELILQKIRIPFRILLSGLNAS